jgi:hypothetical protein
VCALCGEPAAIERGVIFLGLLGEIGRMNQWSSDAPYVLLPLCHKHRWFRRGWPLTAQILLALPFLVLMMMSILASGIGPHRWPVMLLLLGGVTAIDLCLLGWLIKTSLRIRALRVNARDVVLVGLASKFVRACEEMQEREANHVVDSLSSGE